MLPVNNTYDHQPGLLRAIQPTTTFILIILVALVAFEIFNFSTTEHALQDLLGDLNFFGLSWSVILTIAFCGIDFAGVARLFTPEQGADEPKEVWYLFGAWLLAATMNAMLTWWGVSIAVTNHYTESSSVIDPETMTRVVPVFVAIMVWVIRILIIGTLSLALDKAVHPGQQHTTMLETGLTTSLRTSSIPASTLPARLSTSAIPSRPAARMNAPSRPNRTMNTAPVMPVYDEEEEEEIFAEAPALGRMAPTYHTLSGRDRPNGPAGTAGGHRRR